MPMRRRPGTHGYSLIELVVSAAIALTVTSVVFTLLRSSQNEFARQSEIADMQQRLRAAFDTLHRDLVDAHGQPAQGHSARSSRTIPPLMPFRLGLRDADPQGTARSDAMTVLIVPEHAPEAAIDQPLAAASGSVVLRLASGCPPGDLACGFREGMDVLVHDETSAFDLYTITDVSASTLTLDHVLVDWPKMYPAGSVLTQVESHTYFLRNAQSTRPPQLARYGGGRRNDVPVVDHVVGLSFEYYGEAEPPAMVRPLGDPIRPWMTYGPPPQPDPASVPPVPLSNCVLVANGTPMASSRLPALGAAGGPLVPLTVAQLSDGPFCPDDAAPSRFDADLLRVRSVGVRLRVQAAQAALRGPAGGLFALAGTARMGERYVPDIEVGFRVTPRQLASGR